MKSNKSAKRINDAVIDSSIHDLLKVAAVNGETLETVLSDAFAEMYSDEPGPVLGQFAIILLSKLKLKKVLAKAFVESLHTAASEGRDIYDHVDYLEKNRRHISATSLAFGMRHAKLIAQS